MEPIEKSISEVRSQYAINTGSIFRLLTGLDDKWKNYDRQFLITTFQDAIHSVLWQTNIITVQYDGENGSYLENYEEIRYPGALKNAEDSRIFPFPDYFLRKDKESGYLNIVNYDEYCLINRWDYDFDLFFSLQFSLMEIVKSDEPQAEYFLKYHLRNTFENDFQLFKTFLENVCSKYSEFLKNKYEPQVKRFIENEIAAQKVAVSDVDSNVSFETNKPIETSQLSINSNQISDNPSTTSEQPEFVSDSSNSEKTSIKIEGEKNIQTENIVVVPNGYKIIEGKFSLKDIHYYFSFLYKEISEDGKPFLKEENVMEIFKYGIAIPPEPLSKKYKLNCGTKYPKNIVEYCIYTFYENYTDRNKEKKDILSFFANYFTDFEAALENKKKFQIWSNNVTGERPKLIDFDINIYLPADSKTEPPSSIIS